MGVWEFISRELGFFFCGFFKADYGVDWSLLTIHSGYLGDM